MKQHQGSLKNSFVDFLRRNGLVKKEYKTIISLPDPPKEKRLVCNHTPLNEWAIIGIFGQVCEVEKSSMCFSCTEKYFNTFSTICAACGIYITPNSLVAQAWDGSKYPFTHLDSGCCDNLVNLFCGKWGEGRLITLHEINPEDFPDKAPRSYASHKLRKHFLFVV